MEKVNKIYVVGTLKTVEARRDQKDGKNYIGGKFTVQVGPESDNNIIEMKFYSNELTTEGKANKRYSNYNNLESMLNRRVVVSGELNGRAFYQASQGQVIHFNEVNAGFINLAKDTDADVATFEFSGFVSKPLYERRDKNENIVAYEIEISQANYNGENMRTIRFTVDKDSLKMQQSIQNYYTKNTTVAISGEIRYIKSMVEKVEEVAFGDALVKKFENVLKTFVITGGKNPIVGDAAYTPAQISTLEAAYQKYLLEVEAEGKNDSQSGKTVVEKEPVKTDRSKLL